MQLCYSTYVLFLKIQDTAGKYRELTDKKCHHVPKPAVDLQKPCLLKECPVQATPAFHRWSTYRHTFPQPLPHPPPPAEWISSPWSQVCLLVERWHSRRSSQCRFCVLHSAQWRVGEACKVGQSSVWSRGNHLLAAPTILNHWCHRLAIPTSVHNLTRKVTKPKEVLTNQSRANKVSFFVLPQTLHVGITSTGATWFLSMVSATTSSTASSAASLAQTQTYNPIPSPKRPAQASVIRCLWLDLAHGERCH